MAVEESTIGALLDETGGSIKTGPFGTKLKASEYTATGVPVISVGEVGFGRLRIHHDTPRVDETVSSRMPEFLLKAGDIVFGRKGAVERSAQVQPDEDGYFLGSDGIRIRLNVSVCDPRFVSYQLQTAAHRSWMIQHAAGTTMPSLNEGIIRRIPIVLKPLAEQKAIAAALGALDDKIELNRRMNETLEAMARALFQSWFVDFDPVRAKLEARSLAGLDQATAAHFPASFQDSPLGPIPHGWTATTLGQVCEQGGGNIQTGPFGTQLHASDYVDEGIPSIMPSDLRDNRIDIGSIARIRDEDAKRLNMYRVQAGDVVYSRRGDVERRSLIRRNEDGWLCGTGCLRVRFGPRGLNPFFGASYLGTLESRAWVVRHAVGATMPNLNTSILGALPMVVPPAELQTRFAKIVGPWDERGTIALHQSRTLATLRDTLLPKLLSGELSVTQQ